MKQWNIDVAVLCIFFARPEQFEKTFEQVKKARPKILLLWQDGPRENRPDDLVNIMECRKIGEKIDWNCRVYKSYHSSNMGCDPSTFYSHKWAFSIVNKCIVLEDDIVVSQSFFYFCKELLDRYEFDERIDRICGQTLFGGIPDKRYSYFFASVGSSWGWASWRRVAETWEENYDVLDDTYYLNLLDYKNESSTIHRRMINEARQHRIEKIPHWEHVLGISTALNSRLIIYPTVNLVENIGTSINATHAADHIEELPMDVRAFFETKSMELAFPLRHPKYIIEDYSYKKKMMDVLQPGFVRKLKRKLERVFLRFLRR